MVYLVLEQNPPKPQSSDCQSIDGASYSLKRNFKSICISDDSRICILVLLKKKFHIIKNMCTETIMSVVFFYKIEALISWVLRYGFHLSVVDLNKFCLL